MFSNAWHYASARQKAYAIGLFVSAGFVPSAVFGFMEQERYVEAVEQTTLRPSLVRLTQSKVLGQWALEADAQAREGKPVYGPSQNLRARALESAALSGPDKVLIPRTTPTVLDTTPKPHAPSPWWWVTIVAAPCLAGKQVGQALVRAPLGCTSPWLLRASKLDPVVRDYVALDDAEPFDSLYH
jgi:hypothetical protein